jgi:hypothetical protein
MIFLQIKGEILFEEARISLKIRKMKIEKTLNKMQIKKQEKTLKKQDFKK